MERNKHIRHKTADADNFTGLEGEITIDLDSKSIRVHDGSTPGGFETARKDLTNVAGATSSADGKMTASHVNQIESLDQNKADKVAGATSGNVAALDVNGNLLDGGVDVVTIATKASPATAGNLAELDVDGNLVDSSIASSDVEQTFIDAQATALFLPKAANPADMTVVISAGRLAYDSSVIVKGTQTTSAISAPVTDSRIDRIVIDERDGSYWHLAGVESATPTPPAIPDGYLPNCQFPLDPATTAITDAMIVDERVLFSKKLDKSTELMSVSSIISVSGLSIPLGTWVRFEAQLSFVTGNISSGYLIINGDTTTTNYYHKILVNGDETVNISGNSPLAFSGDVGDKTVIRGTLRVDSATGICLATINSSSWDDSVLAMSMTQVAYRYSNGAIITSLDLRDSGGNSYIDAGSVLRVYVD